MDDARRARGGLALDLGGAPLEAWAFRAGCKPVVFLTVEPAREAATLAHFPGVHVERRERRVAIGPGDRHDDDRGRGAPRIELYLARDPALARRAAALQTDDPSRHVVELGALLGYPACCVDAFARQDQRGDNTRNRYLTAARTPAGVPPWPWPLNELHLRLVPFYPCTYRCDAALAFATATLAALDGARPGTTATLAAALGRPVLYLDHDRQLWLDGTSAPDRAWYRAVEPIGAAPDLPALAATLARGDELSLTADAIAIRRSGQPVEVARLPRVAPTPGFLARFA